MLVLRIMLYSILMTCILWASMVVFGPAVIKYFLKRQLDNDLLITNLRVSPKLEIKASRLQFAFGDLGNGEKIRVQAAAPQVTWSFEEGVPNIHIFLGPTFFQDLGALEEINVVYRFSKFFSWFDGLVDANIKNINIYNQLDIEHINVVADLVITDLTLRGATISGNTMTFKTEEGVISILETSISLPSLNASGIEADNDGLMLIAVEAANYDTEEIDLEIYDLKFDVSSKKGRLEYFVGELSSHRDDTFLFSLKEIFGETNLSIEPSNEGSVLNGKTKLNSELLDNILLDKDVLIKFPQTDLRNCFFDHCRPSAVDISYSLSVSGEQISVHSLCKLSDCVSQTYSHQVKTSNTLRIMEELAETRVFNPAILFLGMQKLTEGLKIGDGHKIEF